MRVVTAFLKERLPMGKLAIKYSALLTLFLGEGWFFYVLTNDFSPEPLTMIITGLSIFIFMEYQEQTKVDITDKKLFQDFLENLPYEGGISFIDSTDMNEAVYDPKKHDASVTSIFTGIMHLMSFSIRI